MLVRVCARACPSFLVLFLQCSLREALELVSIMESDTEILDRLFSMFDKTGNDQINYKEFVAGLAPLCHGTVEEKLACEQSG